MKYKSKKKKKSECVCGKTAHIWKKMRLHETTRPFPLRSFPLLHLASPTSAFLLSQMCVSNTCQRHLMSSYSYWSVEWNTLRGTSPEKTRRGKEERDQGAGSLRSSRLACHCATKRWKAVCVLRMEKKDHLRQCFKMLSSAGPSHLELWVRAANWSHFCDCPGGHCR